MAKKRKYRTKEEAEFARKDDLKKEKELQEREEEAKKERARKDELPMLSLCQIPGSTKWFWATWTKAADAGKSQSTPAQYGSADGCEVAVQAAAKAAGPDAWESTAASAGAAHQHLTNIKKL
jgi:hypothetical protein